MNEATSTPNLRRPEEYITGRNIWHGRVFTAWALSLLSMLLQLPREEWAGTPLNDLLRSYPPSIHEDEPIEYAVQQLIENSVSVLPVLGRQSGEFLGTITSQDVFELMEFGAQVRRRWRQDNDRYFAST